MGYESLFMDELAVGDALVITHPKTLTDETRIVKVRRVSNLFMFAKRAPRLDEALIMYAPRMFGRFHMSQKITRRPFAKSTVEFVCNQCRITDEFMSA